MSNQPQTRASKDAKNRREYLLKKAKVIVPAIFTGTISVLLVASVLKLALQPSTMSAAQIAVFVLCLVLMVPSTIIIIMCEKKALSIPYVPSVRDQVAALPADEVLLRGADQPAATPGELLRAAEGAPNTDAEELLRQSGR